MCRAQIVNVLFFFFFFFFALVNHSQLRVASEQGLERYIKRLSRSNSVVVVATKKTRRMRFSDNMTVAPDGSCGTAYSVGKSCTMAEESESC